MEKNNKSSGNNTNKTGGNNSNKRIGNVDKKRLSQGKGEKNTEKDYSVKYKRGSGPDWKDKTGKLDKDRGLKNSVLKSEGLKGKGFTERRTDDKGIKGKGLREESNQQREKSGDGNYKKGNKSEYKSVYKLGSKNLKCPVMYKCGGCQLLHLEYEKQLNEKQKKVQELLGQFGKVETIIGMENPNHYRNKVHAVFDHDRRGNAISGVYEAGSHRVVPVDSCLIENEKADEIIVSIRGLLKSFKIKTYDEDTEYGLLRHVLIRTGHKSGQIMVVLVLASPILPSKNNFVKALRKLHPEITTVIINVNNKNTSMVLGDKEQVIYGKGYIEDTLCEKVFHISPKSFYQVNPVQTEVLYKKAIDLAGLTGKETIIDAYCGIGTIGIIASDLAKKVIGVELNTDAVKDANSNAKRNQITNIDFYNKDAGEFMSQMAEQNQKAEVVFMDPPRAGSDEKFLTSLCSLAPEKVVYISCNPVTLSGDLEFLVKKGYRVKKMIPVDMFPNT
ncbi:MAG: 23S rRNA (uracil(1939)-C(5))-methyltransferase RlmD, partial [Anaerocolumna sp.]